VELQDLVQPLKRWWWLIVLATLLALLSSLLYTSQQPPTYSSTVTLMVGNAIQNLNPSNNEFTLTQQLADTYVDMVKRRPVQDATKEALGINRLPDHYAYRIDRTQLFAVTVVDTDPARSQAVASEIANQLILQSPAGTNQDHLQRQEFVRQQLDQIQTGIVDTQNEIRNKQIELAQLFQARQIADTQAQITALQGNLSMLQQTYANLLSSTQRGSINTINVIEPAYLPTRPTASNQLRLIILAAMMGFVLAAGAAYALEYLDDSVRRPADVARLFGIKALGAIPTRKRRANNALAWGDQGSSEAREAYRRLRANFESIAEHRTLRTVMVAAPTALEDTAAVVANLGLTLAQAGERVIMIDANLHQPQLHTFFSLENGNGLSNLLLDWRSGLNGLQLTWHPGLYLLPAGPRFADQGEMFNPRRIQMLLDEFTHEADVILLNVPPVGAVADATILAPHVHGVLLVVDIGRTRRQSLRESVDHLNEVGAELIGAVLTQVAAEAMDDRYASKPVRRTGKPSTRVDEKHKPAPEDYPVLPQTFSSKPTNGNNGKTHTDPAPSNGEWARKRSPLS
jgi:capsular exopolysaccharide synthesis family protein